MEKRRFKNTGFCLRRIVTAVVIFTLLFPYFSDILPESEVQAAKVLRLEQCKSIAVKNSDKIDSYDIQIEAKQAARESAVRSISEKYINMQERINLCCLFLTAVKMRSHHCTIISLNIIGLCFVRILPKILRWY